MASFFFSSNFVLFEMLISVCMSSLFVVMCLIAPFHPTLQLGTVSLALFRTLIGLYCEDVMLQLVLR